MACIAHISKNILRFIIHKQNVCKLQYKLNALDHTGIYGHRLYGGSCLTGYHTNSDLTTSLLSSKYHPVKAMANCRKKTTGPKSSFQEVLNFRKKQAECSVLVELSSKDDISAFLPLCEQYGDIENVLSYPGELENIFCLVEFGNKDEAEKFLSNCQCTNIADAFPIHSRLVRFEKKYERDEIKSMKTPDKVITEPQPSPSAVQVTVSQLIEDIYISEKLSELDIRIRFFFCALVKDSILGLFPHCDVFPFGSSVNGIGREGCDLDAMIRLYPEQINDSSELLFIGKTCIGDVKVLRKKVINCLGELIRTFMPGVGSLQKILHARMPIVKFSHKILGLECDISVNNVSAVYMSEILYFCCEIDSRFRVLMYAVKKWAKEARVTYESPGSWITNFSLTLLMIYFLQTRPTPILPPLQSAISIIGEDSSVNYKLEYTKPVSEWQTAAMANKESLAILLKEFFTFLSKFPFKEKHISIITAEATPRKNGHPIWIQYPMEEDQNVSKNVSDSELSNMIEMARMSMKSMNGSKNPRDFLTLVGITNLKKMFPNRLDAPVLNGDFHRAANQRATFARSR